MKVGVFMTEMFDKYFMSTLTYTLPSIVSMINFGLMQYVCVIHILSIMVKNILHLNVSRIKCVWNEHFGLIGDICDA